jgi:hypothetical protein
VQIQAASNSFPFALVVMAAELSEFVQSVESAGKDETFDEFVIAGLAANHITVCVCLRRCHVLGCLGQLTGAGSAAQLRRQVCPIEVG